MRSKLLRSFGRLALSCVHPTAADRSLALALTLLGGLALGPAALAQDEDPAEGETPEEAPADVPEEESPEEAAPAQEAPDPAPVVAIRAKKVVVRPGDVRENVIVLVEGRRIAAVGADVEIPVGAEILEGEVVCAGFIDPWSIAGLEASSANASDSAAFARAADVVDPYGQDRVLDELVSAGVLLTRSLVGARAELGGVSVLLRTADAAPVDDESALHASLGVGGGAQVFQQTANGFVVTTSAIDPLERISQIDKLVDEIRDGVKYGQDLAAYERDLAEWEAEIAAKEKELEDDFKKAKKARDKAVEKAQEDGKEHKEKKYKESRRPREPRFDPEKAVFAQVANGDLPLVVRADRALEIRDLLRQTKEFPRLRLVLAGGTSALACAGDIVERGVPVIVAPSPAQRPGATSELDPGLALAGELHAAGIEVLIGSGATSSLASRDLPLLAALAVGHGLDPDAALHAITVGPARVFDVGRDIGRVQKGRGAELLVLSGDPLSSSTRVLAAISNGEVVHRAAR